MAPWNFTYEGIDHDSRTGRPIKGAVLLILPASWIVGTNSAPMDYPASPTPIGPMTSASSASAAPANPLALETSPSLLQHRHNPVDWGAWGPDALNAAKQSNKPILLSIGYAAC